MSESWTLESHRSDVYRMLGLLRSKDASGGWDLVKLEAHKEMLDSLGATPAPQEADAAKCEMAELIETYPRIRLAYIAAGYQSVADSVSRHLDMFANILSERSLSGDELQQKRQAELALSTVMKAFDDTMECL
jgi:hypothetical protein